MQSPGPRQRWRIVFRRTASDVPHRDIADGWLHELTSRLPVAGGDSGRPKPALTFAAAMPVGVECRRELADLALAERLPAWQVRDAVVAATPADVSVVEIYDVWSGSPAIAGETVAADYLVHVSGTPEPGVLRDAAARLLAADRFERTRTRGDRQSTYDLRALVESIDTGADADAGGTVLRIRTRFHPERGAGRPDEVVAAIAELSGVAVESVQTVRERVLLRDDVV
jgi:radical SAM-linked protein